MVRKITKMTGNPKIFSVSKASHLDGWLRRLLFQPDRFVTTYVRTVDKVLDIGCGPFKNMEK